LKSKWSLDINADDFDKEIKRQENDKAKKSNMEEERKKRIADEEKLIAKLIKERQLEYKEIDKRRGKQLSVKTFDAQKSETARKRYNEAMKNGDSKLAVRNLFSFVQDERVEATFVKVE